MSELRLVHALGLELPSRLLLDRYRHQMQVALANGVNIDHPVNPRGRGYCGVDHLGALGVDPVRFLSDSESDTDNDSQSEGESDVSTVSGDASDYSDGVQRSHSVASLEPFQKSFPGSMEKDTEDLISNPDRSETPSLPPAEA